MTGPLGDLRRSARSLWKAKGFAFVAILTLGLGIGCNTAVFSLLNAVLLRPLPYEEPERLVLVWESAPFFGVQDSPVSPANYRDWQARARSFEEIGAVEMTGYRLADGDGPPQLVRGAAVTAGLFRALRTKPLHGRLFREDEDRLHAPKVAVIAESLWRSSFASDPGIVGRSIRLNDEMHTVVGVIRSGTEPPSQYNAALGQIWTPLGASYTPADWNQRGRHNWMVVARLSPGVTLQQADAEMRSIGQALAREYPETNEKVGAFVAPMRDHFVRENRRLLFLLLGAVVFVLLIACANVANLLLCRAAGRSKEIGVRAALGGSGWQLARGFVADAALLSVTGGALGVLLATATFRFLARLAPGDMAGFQSVSLDLRVLGFTGALSAAVAAVFSLIPLWKSRRLDLVELLKQNARTLAASGSSRTRAWLVGGEVALAFVLAVGAALLLQTFARVRGVETGFRTRGILTLSLPKFSAARPDPARIEAWQKELRRRIEEIPGVVSAGFTNHIPIAFKGDISGVAAEGRHSREQVQCRSRTAGPGYLATMGIAIVKGRDIAETDRDGTPRVVLINEALARELWPGVDPIGRNLVFEAGIAATVVGVVADIHQDGLDVSPKPEFYLPSYQAGFPSRSLAIRTEVEPGSIANAVRRAVWSLDRQQPVVEVFTMEQILDREVAERGMHATLLSAFAGLAVLLGAVGLYGVLAYSVGQRLPEFGVRLALGATPASLVTRVVARGAALTLAGLAAGVCAAAALSRVLRAFLFGVRETDPPTYAAVAGVLLLTALLASYLPARRAMRVDPAMALRDE